MLLVHMYIHITCMYTHTHLIRTEANRDRNRIPFIWGYGIESRYNVLLSLLLLLSLFFIGITLDVGATTAATTRESV